jgi:hypothetical protein
MIKDYAFSDLAIGQYALDVNHAGFLPYRREEINVTANAASGSTSS